MHRNYTINPTGKPLDVTDPTPSTVCISTDVMKYKIESRIRERERKLFVLLVHAVWDELGEKTYHTVKIEEIKKVFQKVGNVKDYNDWLWDYLDNLSDIKIRYEDDRFKGVTRLFAEAWVDKKKNEVKFCIPPTLTHALLSAEYFARLDTYFIVGLKGKYSIALYQFLESKIGMKKFDPHFTPNEEERFIEISLTEIRNVLSVREGEYKLWNDFNKRVLKPAIKEINTNPLHSTFKIKIEMIRGKRRKVVSIKFFLEKTPERIENEAQIQQAISLKKPTYLDKALDKYSTAIPEPKVMEIVKKHAPEYDYKYLYIQWRKKAASEKQYQNTGSFVQYCKSAGRKKRQEKPTLIRSILQKAMN